MFLKAYDLFLLFLKQIDFYFWYGLSCLLFYLKQCRAIIYYKQKLIHFNRDDTTQAKGLIFIVVPQAEQVAKLQKKQQKRSYRTKFC